MNELLLGDEAWATTTRLRHQYEELYERLLKNKGKAAADAFINAIATLEAAAELGDSDKMHIIAVLADGKTELAGSGMSAFVGFFDAKFREHDYLVGRIKARTYLQRKDVQAILNLNLKAVEAGWQPLGDPKAIVQVPLSLTQQWRAGRKWLLYGISLRIPRWVKIGVSAVLGVLVYVALAHQYRWWPF